jgi:hypothetical protein
MLKSIALGTSSTTTTRLQILIAPTTTIHCGYWPTIAPINRKRLSSNCWNCFKPKCAAMRSWASGLLRNGSKHKLEPERKWLVWTDEIRSSVCKSKRQCLKQLHSNRRRRHRRRHARLGCIARSAMAGQKPSELSAQPTRSDARGLAQRGAPMVVSTAGRKAYLVRSPGHTPLAATAA